MKEVCFPSFEHADAKNPAAQFHETSWSGEAWKGEAHNIFSDDLEHFL